MEHDATTPQPSVTGSAIAYGVLASPVLASSDGTREDAQGGGTQGGAIWIKIAPLGVVQGRDGRGPYDFGDRAAAAAIVAATKAYLAGIDGNIDYDHLSDLGAARGLARSPAAGWIKDWAVRGDGIHGLVEWTKRAAAHIEAREYRYISPTFNHDAQGRVTRIIRAGLVAHPNFQMPALAAASPITKTEDDMTIPKQVGPNRNQVQVDITEMVA